MITESKPTLILSIIAIILLIGGVYYFVSPKNSAPTFDSITQEENSEEAPTTTTATPSVEVPASSSVPVKSPVKKPVSKTPAPAPMTYQEALNAYAPGRMFQFVSCHGTPGSMIMKTGTKFMLDNRDSVKRTIAIDGYQSYSLPAYEFKIATAPATEGTYYITCDGGGAASINVQK